MTSAPTTARLGPSTAIAGLVGGIFGAIAGHDAAALDAVAVVAGTGVATNAWISRAALAAALTLAGAWAAHREPARGIVAGVQAGTLAGLVAGTGEALPSGVAWGWRPLVTATEVGGVPLDVAMAWALAQGTLGQVLRLAAVLAAGSILGGIGGAIARPWPAASPSAPLSDATFDTARRSTLFLVLLLVADRATVEALAPATRPPGVLEAVTPTRAILARDLVAHLLTAGLATQSLLAARRPHAPRLARGVDGLLALCAFLVAWFGHTWWAGPTWAWLVLVGTWAVALGLGVGRAVPPTVRRTGPWIAELDGLVVLQTLGLVAVAAAGPLGPRALHAQVLVPWMDSFLSRGAVPAPDLAQTLAAGRVWLQLALVGLVLAPAAAAILARLVARRPPPQEPT